jgi:hypothetical protein
MTAPAWRTPRARIRLPGARDPPRTDPPLPAQTNGKAESFIRTLIAGRAYAAAYRSSTPPRIDGCASTTALAGIANPGKRPDGVRAASGQSSTVRAPPP